MLKHIKECLMFCFVFFISSVIIFSSFSPNLEIVFDIIFSGSRSRGYNLPISWTGNELCGEGVGTKVLADQYALDTIALEDLVQRVYKGIKPKPLILAPGGFFDEKWFMDFIDKTTPTLGAVTHHLYNLGAGILARSN